MNAITTAFTRAMMLQLGGFTKYMDRLEVAVQEASEILTDHPNDNRDPELDRVCRLLHTVISQGKEAVEKHGK